LTAAEITLTVAELVLTANEVLDLTAAEVDSTVAEVVLTANNEVLDLTAAEVDSTVAEVVLTAPNCLHVDSRFLFILLYVKCLTVTGKPPQCLTRPQLAHRALAMILQVVEGAAVGLQQMFLQQLQQMLPSPALLLEDLDRVPVLHVQ